MGGDEGGVDMGRRGCRWEGEGGDGERERDGERWVEMGRGGCTGGEGGCRWREMGGDEERWVEMERDGWRWVGEGRDHCSSQLVTVSHVTFWFGFS